MVLLKCFTHGFIAVMNALVCDPWLWHFLVILTLFTYRNQATIGRITLVFSEAVDIEYPDKLSEDEQAYQGISHHVSTLSHFGAQREWY